MEVFEFEELDLFFHLCFLIYHFYNIIIIIYDKSFFLQT